MRGSDQVVVYIGGRPYQSTAQAVVRECGEMYLRVTPASLQSYGITDATVREALVQFDRTGQS